ncbi:MAG TPA: phosphate signaling complex protein PhoU [Longilinea sp.]|nr:phosphate signaling complex protein PhoU [Longilinea sp.]
MTRETLDRQIRHIQDEVLLLGSMVEQATMAAIDTLKNRDTQAARKIYDQDQNINEKRYAIENAILILIATQQPMAHDLRMQAAILEVITELERMGDYAKGIAKITVRLGDADIPIPIREIEKMAKLGVDMLHRSLTAFVDENASMAAAIPAEDSAVDELFQTVYHFVVNAMISNPETIDTANLLLWVAHNLERLADRVTNICERTVFIATGELMEMDPYDSEEVSN